MEGLKKDELLKLARKLEKDNASLTEDVEDLKFANGILEAQVGLLKGVVGNFMPEVAEKENI